MKQPSGRQKPYYSTGRKKLTTLPGGKKYYPPSRQKTLTLCGHGKFKVVVGAEHTLALATPLPPKPEILRPSPNIKKSPKQADHPPMFDTDLQS